MFEVTKKSRHPFVRNHFLPKWLHRFCNALLSALGIGVALLLLWPSLRSGMIAIAVFFIMLLVDPDRLSFVEGIAGGEGYSDLEDKNSLEDNLP